MKIEERTKSIASTGFVRGSFLYLFGGVVNAVLGLVVLPIFTRFLSPDDYGILATSTVLVQVFTIVLGFNGWGLIARSHFDDDADSQRRLLSTNIIFAGALSVPLVGILVLLQGLTETFTKFPGAWLPVVVLVTLFGVVRTNYLSLVQAQSRPKHYVVVQSLGTALELGLGVVFVVLLGMRWEGRMLAIVISAFVITLFCLYAMTFWMHLLRPIFDQKSLVLLLNFGVPLIPHFIGGWVMTMAPRLYMNNMATVADTGLFSVAFNLASPIALVIGAANQAYWPTLFSKLSNPSLDRVRLSRLLLLAVAVLPLCAIAYGIFVRYLLPLIVGPRFYGATDYVIWFALAFAFQGIYFIFGNFVIYSKRTTLIAWRADFLGGVIVMMVCPLLIYFNGPIGAAQAIMLGFAVSVVGCFTASRKAYPMPWRDALLSLAQGPFSVLRKDWTTMKDRESEQ